MQSLYAATVVSGAEIQKTNYDKLLRLKKIFLFPAVDDLSGILSPQLDQTLQEIFTKNQRFELVRDQSVVRALSPDESAYAKVAQNENIHKEATNITGSDATIVLRTKNAGGTLTMILEWRDQQGKILISDAQTMPGFSSAQEQKKAAEKLVENTIQKIPFLGTVTGRTGKTITLDLGKMDVMPGDTIDIARMVSLQRHPLLNTIVDVDYVRVGRAIITMSDRVLSFAEILEETQSELISINNKIVNLKKGERLPKRKKTEEGIFSIKKTENPYKEKSLSEETENKDLLAGDFERPKARFGAAGVSLLIGNLSQAQTIGGITGDFSGRGIGASLDGELWITKQWIGAVEYSFLSASLSGSRAGSVADAGNTAWKKMNIYGGYRLFAEGKIEGLAVLIAGGYQSVKMSLPVNGALQLGEKEFSGLFFKIEGDLPVNNTNRVVGGIEFQPFSTFSEFGYSPGSNEGANSVGFRLRWMHAMADNLWARIGFDYDSSTGSYTGGGASSSKRVSISPGISYLF